MIEYKLKYFNEQDKQRFWNRVIKTDSCWHFSLNDKTTIPNGYGSFASSGQCGFLAHRVAWMITNNSDWPVDKPHARHICNTPSCVNPDHIVPGSAKENMRDRALNSNNNWHKNVINAVKQRSSKKCITPLGVFDSVVEAAKAHGEPYTTIQTRIKRYPNNGYEYLTGEMK